MTDQIQYDLYQRTHQQAFDAWVQTPVGGAAANLFIRLAIACSRSGVKVGQREIWERMRWHYRLSARKRAEAERTDCKLNDHYHAYMARFAMERVPALQGFFNLRSVGKRRVRRAVVVPIRDASA